ISLMLQLTCHLIFLNMKHWIHLTFATLTFLHIPSIQDPLPLQPKRINYNDVTPLNSSVSSVSSDSQVSPPRTPFSELSAGTVYDVVKENSLLNWKRIYHIV
ncbi:hypothetical protein BC833DRAFT_567253, partial [Globomyces pollinis-pini]